MAISPSPSPATGRTTSCGSLGDRKPTAFNSAFRSTLNQRVWLGHFEVWDDGEIIFRHAMSLMTGERPSLAQAAAMIDVAMEAADRFYPAFDFLVGGSKSPADAIAACMFETVGEA